MIEYIGLFLAGFVLIGGFIYLGVMANHFQNKSMRPGGGIFFIVYLFASAFLFLGIEALIVLINYFTGFAVLL